MNKEEIMQMVKVTAQNSVQEVLDEAQEEIIKAVKDALVPALKERKDNLVETLTAEIAQTSNWGVKARDVIYVLILNIVEKIFNNIEQNVIK